MYKGSGHRVQNIPTTTICSGCGNLVIRYKNYSFELLKRIPEINEFFLTELGIRKNSSKHTQSLNTKTRINKATKRLCMHKCSKEFQLDRFKNGEPIKIKPNKPK